MQPYLGSVAVTGPFAASGGAPVESRPRAVAVSSPAVPSAGPRPKRTSDCARRDPDEPGAARLPPASDTDRRSRRPARLLRRGPVRGRLRRRHRDWRCAGCWPVRSSCCGSSATPSVSHPGRELRDQRPGAGVAALVLPLEQHSGRRVARPRRGRPAARPGGPGAADPADARPTSARGRWSPASPASGSICATCRQSCRTRTAFPTSARACGRRCGARRSCSSRASSAKTATCWTC